MRKQRIIRTVIVVMCGIISFETASCLTSVPEQSETTIETTAGNSYQEKSDLEIADDVSIVLTADVNSDQVMNLTLKNNTKRYVLDGEMYYIEYNYDGDWYKVPKLPDVYFPMIAYDVEPGKERTCEVVIGWTHGVLAPGHYRIVKSVFVSDTMDDDTNKTNSDEYYIAAEFDI